MIVVLAAVTGSIVRSTRIAAAAVTVEAVLATMAAILFLVTFHYGTRNHRLSYHRSHFWMVFSAAALTAVFWTATVALEWMNVYPYMMDEAHTVIEVATTAQLVIAAFYMLDAEVDMLVE